MFKLKGVLGTFVLVLMLMMGFSSAASAVDTPAPAPSVSAPAQGGGFSSVNNGKVNGTTGGSLTSVNPVVFVGPQSAAVPGIVSNVNKSLGDNGTILIWDSTNMTLSFNVNYYDALDQSERRDLMEKMLTTVSKSDLNFKQKNKIYNFIADQDTPISGPIRMMHTNTNPDIAGAGSIVKPAFGIFNVVLGIVIIVMLMVMIFSVVIDLFYITTPLGKSKVGPNTEGAPRKVFAVTPAAVLAVDMGAQNYNNGLWYYVKSRSFTMILTSTVLVLVATGKIWDVLFVVGDAIQVFIPTQH